MNHIIKNVGIPLIFGLSGAIVIGYGLQETVNAGTQALYDMQDGPKGGRSFDYTKENTTQTAKTSSKKSQEDNNAPSTTTTKSLSKFSGRGNSAEQNNDKKTITSTKTDTPKAPEYITLSDNSHLKNKQSILEVARIIDVNAAEMHYFFGREPPVANDYDYQLVTVVQGGLNTQKNVKCLTTKQTLALARGLTYKIYYHALKQGDVLTELGLYQYALPHIRPNSPDYLKNNNSPLYGRKLSGIEGVIDSVQLIR
jgi:hypothetical protein